MIVFEGDSITWGATLADSDSQAWPHIAMTGIDCPYSIQAMPSDRISDLVARAASVDALMDSDTNILFVMVGTNDIVLDDRDAQDVFNDLEQYCLARIAAGWDEIKIVQTLPRAPASYQEKLEIQAYNGLVSQNYNDFADVYIPFESWVLRSDLYSDGTHPNESGHFFIGCRIQQFIK